MHRFWNDGEASVFAVRICPFHSPFQQSLPKRLMEGPCKLSVAELYRALDHLKVCLCQIHSTRLSDKSLQ